MITKERIDELLSQKAKIWGIGKSGNVFCVGLKFRPQTLNNKKWLENKYEVYGKFFETEEEAKWVAEFGCIERTERLELPTWEEVEIKFNKKQIIEMYFYYAKHFSAPKENNVEKTYSIYLLTNGHIVIDDNREVKTIFNEELTKENYTLACRKAKELFLGLGEKK